MDRIAGVKCRVQRQIGLVGGGSWALQGGVLAVVNSEERYEIQYVQCKVFRKCNNSRHVGLVRGYRCRKRRKERGLP